MVYMCSCWGGELNCLAREGAKMQCDLISPVDEQSENKSQLARRMCWLDRCPPCPLGGAVVSFPGLRRVDNVLGHCSGLTCCSEQKCLIELWLCVTQCYKYKYVELESGESDRLSKQQNSWWSHWIMIHPNNYPRLLSSGINYVSGLS